MNLSSKLESARDLAEILPEKLTLWNGRIEITKSTSKKGQDWIKYPREKLSDWPPNKGTYEIRDPSIPVAFVCPSQDQELQAKAINWGAGISGPCVTPDRGIELLIANVVANPNIRYLVLGGMDSGHLSGDVLFHLWKDGINIETRRVLGTSCPTNPYLKNLSLEAIERFRKQITVINLLKCKDESLLHLAIRACMQEPEAPVVFIDKKLDIELRLFDKGAYPKEALIIKLGLGADKNTFFEGVHRVGTSIHAPSVAEAWPLLRSHILKMGSIGIQESTRTVKDVVGLQLVIHRPGSKLCPDGWRPHSWTKDKKDVEDWLEAYAIWVYLFPFSDVRLDEESGRIVPYIPEKMDYSYGTRLTAWGIESASEKEKQSLMQAIKKLHAFYIKKKRHPTFNETIKIYEKLTKIQSESINSLFRLAQAVKVCVENDITSAYRNYIVLQDPRVDIKSDLRLAHNPCFCLFEAYPRKIEKKWQLDVSFFLRANDFVAFPANAAAGIKLQQFLAWHAGIKPGIYLQHTGCAHIQDYLL